MGSLTGKKLLLAEPIYGAELTYDFVKETGCELIVGPHVSKTGQGYSEAQLIEFGNEVDAFIGMSREKMTKRVIENSKRIRVITKTGIGMDHVDVATATECGILVTNTPMNRLSVAEFAIMEISKGPVPGETTLQQSMNCTKRRSGYSVLAVSAGRWRKGCRDGTLR